MEVVASSVEVEVLAAEDSAELFDCLSLVAAAETIAFDLEGTFGRLLGRTGGLVLPPTELAAGAALPLTVLLVFLVLTESLSVSSSSSSSDDPSSSSDPDVLSGEKMLFCLFESETPPPLVLLVATGTLSFCVLVVVDGTVGFGAGVADALGGCILDLILPLPAFEALVFVSPRSCCCCCGH